MDCGVLDPFHAFLRPELVLSVILTEISDQPREFVCGNEAFLPLQLWTAERNSVLTRQDKIVT